jgi:peptidyl-prolyl cis-trans isomerase-like 3
MSVTMHTTVGDIKLELFCEVCPKTCENFLALCGTDYYNNCVFIRNIKVRVNVDVNSLLHNLR